MPFKPEKLEFGKSPEMDLILEKKLLANVHRGMAVVQNPARSSVSTSISGPITRPDSSSSEVSFRSETPRDGEKSQLSSLMISRLSEVEKVVQRQKIDITQKDKHIQDLSKKNKELEIKYIDSQVREKQLEKQIQEMMKFLGDYGLEWIGGEVEAPNNTNNTVREPSPSPSTSPSQQQQSPLKSNHSQKGDQFSFNPHLFKQFIRELNVVAGDGVATVETSEDGTRRLKMPDSLPIAIFKNGIFLQNGPFRSFETDSARDFVTDICDGYFPKELQSRFPNGVPFSLTDNSAQDFDPNVHFSVNRGKNGQFGQPKLSTFGEGRRLGSSRDLHSDSQEKGEKKDAKQDNCGSAGTAIAGGSDKEVFLRQIPDKVIKNGEILSVKEHITAIIGGKTSTNPEQSFPTNIPTHADTIETEGACTTLKVKLLNHIFTLRLLLSDTVGTLRSYVDKVHEKEVKCKCKFTMFSSFPRAKLADNTVSLQEMGLANSVVLVECSNLNSK
eukprot:TRINITY_DN10600_c0_g1_i1.p1 TRINITY_DN10600_c0_g1~~TRINITY_DN10600_c0_g1_i1.p1  ORF type:complete len:569 (-),score=174.07 TRINITY_DN10600_c0_g1_i1:23-1519(-)